MKRFAPGGDVERSTGDSASIPLERDDIGLLAVAGVRWSLAQTAVVRLTNLVSMAILARLLVPHEFGLVAMTTAVLSFLLLFSDLGTGSAIVQRRDRVDGAVEVSFVAGVIMGVACYAAVWLAAPWCGRIFQEETLPDLLRVMGVSFLVVPLGAPQHALLTRACRFKEKCAIEITALVLSVVVSVTMAANGYGVWALASGALAASGAQVIGAWLCVPGIPGFRLSDARLASVILRFGAAVSIQGILVWIVNTADNILVGRRWGAAGLGLYDVGFNIGLLPASAVNGPSSAVAYPIFSRLQFDRNKLQTAYLTTIRYVSLITVPTAVMIVLTADLFVPVYLGEQWMGAIPIVQFVAIYGLFASIGGIMTPLCNAVGRPDLLLKYLAFSVLTAVPTYVAVAPFGIVAMAVAHAVLVCLRFPLDVAIPCRLLGLSPREWWRSIRPSLINSFWLVVTIVILRYIVDQTPALSREISLVFLIGFATAGYTVALYMTDRVSFLRLTAVFYQGAVGNRDSGGKAAQWIGRPTTKSRLR